MRVSVYLMTLLPVDFREKDAELEVDSGPYFKPL